MPKHDPFTAFDSERTLIKPRAGRGRQGDTHGPSPKHAKTPSAGPRAPSGTTSPAPLDRRTAARKPDDLLPPDAVPFSDVAHIAGFNPLLAAATPLLRAAPRIRAMPRHPDPSALRSALIESVRQFEAAAWAAGLPNEQVVAGRYVLCTMIDEAASATPWGGSGVWSRQSLLVTFHSEARGGEKVFQLLSKLVADVPRHRNLLELMSVVLALGFEGRFGAVDDGRVHIEEMRDRLTRMLAPAIGTFEKELSPHWKGAPASHARLSDGVPVWVATVAVAFVSLLIFIGLRLDIEARSNPTFAALQALDVEPSRALAVLPTATAPAAAPRLAVLLEPAITGGLIEVRDLADRSVVTLRGDGIFDAGSAVVVARVVPLMGQIARAIAQVRGPVLVTGYTDSQPIRSLQFPSNWHLSQERARAVSEMLLQTVKDRRIESEGRAESEPIDSNASPEGRARNRRVEITLMAVEG
jgi:type VI secretion system protein ImpK